MISNNLRIDLTHRYIYGMPYKKNRLTEHENTQDKYFKVSSVFKLQTKY